MPGSVFRPGSPTETERDVSATVLPRLILRQFTDNLHEKAAGCRPFARKDLYSRCKTATNMQNLVRNKTVRALCLLAVGILLVAYSEQAPAWIVQGVGVLLIIPGLVSLLSLLRKDRSRRETALYPVMGGVTIVFGLLLLLMPGFFVHASMFVLAALLITAARVQVHSRWRMQKMGVQINGATFLIPLITAGAGIFVLAYRELAAALPFIILGAAYMLYALLELWSALELRKFQRHTAAAERPAGAEPPVEEAVVVTDEATPSTQAGNGSTPYGLPAPLPEAFSEAEEIPEP